MLFPQVAVVRSYSGAIVWFGAVGVLVDQVPYRQGVHLSRAKDERLLALVDAVHEDLHPFFLTLLDLDNPVEVVLHVAFALFHLSIVHFVVIRPYVFVDRSGDLVHAEGREKAVVDTFLERIHVDRLAEVVVGVRIVVSLGRGGQAQLHGG